MLFLCQTKLLVLDLAVNQSDCMLWSYSATSNSVNESNAKILSVSLLIKNSRTIAFDVSFLCTDVMAVNIGGTYSIPTHSQ